MLEKYGSMENLFEWSSPEEAGSSDEEEWYMESSASTGVSSATSEQSFKFSQTPVPSSGLSIAPFTGASKYNKGVTMALDSCVLPGWGRPKELTRLSRFQRNAQRRVTEEWEMDYPYVQESVMQVIEDFREQWEDELVWSYLHVPKPQRISESEVWVRFQDIKKEWKLGRAIHKDRVLVVKEGQHTWSYSISV